MSTQRRGGDSESVSATRKHALGAPGETPPPPATCLGRLGVTVVACEVVFPSPGLPPCCSSLGRPGALQVCSPRVPVLMTRVCRRLGWAAASCTLES